MCPHPSAPHSPPPSGSPTTWKHNVFLCFCGKDTREGFTSHLFQALDSYGIDMFMDDRLPKGRHISELLDRIKRSRISVVVFSENFASSRWCLDELVKILECKETMGQEVLPVFYKVPPSELRDLSKGKTGEHLVKHGEKHGVNSEKIEQWRHAVKSFADLRGWHFTQGIESRLVLDIVETVHRILDLKTTSEPSADQATLEADDDRGSLARQPEETTLEVDEAGGSLAGRLEETPECSEPVRIAILILFCAISLFIFLSIMPIFVKSLFK